MYNRYVRNDAGRYERIPAPDPPPREEPVSPPPEEGFPPPPRETQSAPPPSRDDCTGGNQEKRGFLSGILRKLNLENIDTGDLLLLVLLFLLFQEGEDEELLIALGLLLIL